MFDKFWKIFYKHHNYFTSNVQMCSRERKREKLQSQSCLQREGIKTRILFKTNRERERESVYSQREERFSTFDAISIIPIRNSLFARFVSTIERRKNSIITAPCKIHYTRERMRINEYNKIVWWWNFYDPFHDRNPSSRFEYLYTIE